MTINTQSDVKEVLAERQQRYGTFEENAEIAQALKGAMHRAAGWHRLTPAQREGLDMIQAKIARMLSGDPTYLDNGVDICGYAQLVLASMEADACG